MVFAAVAAIAERLLERKCKMGILSWIIFGLAAGALAKLLMPGRDPGGCIITMALGIAGALVGGFLATQFGYGDLSGFDFRSLLIAVVGALVLLGIYRLMMGNRRQQP
jgi:uncharacterized membrane protein YeaQ/YmgE (transglycosylase-associated protein family)